MLIDHMAKGYSFTTFGSVVDVCVDTLNEWVETHKEFSASKKIAFVKCQEWWERQAAMGLWTDPEGNNLNTTLWIFNMKCRFPKDYRDIQHHSFETKPVEILSKKELIEETKRTIEFLEAEYEESKDAQGQLPPAKG